MEAHIVAEKVAKEIDKIRQKYKCEIGVWLTWRDLLYNFEVMRKENGLNELHFGLQIRIENGNNDQDKTNNGGTT